MVLSFLLKVYKSRTYFSFRDLYLHSLECILLVSWSISAPLAFDPNLGAKAGGGGENLTFMQHWPLTDPILTFVDRCLIGLLYYIFSDD